MWPMAPTGGLEQPCLSLSREDTNGEHLVNAHLASAHLRWRRDALHRPRIQRVLLSRNTCVHIPDDGLRCVTWNMRGLFGSPASPQLSRENTSTSLDLPRTTTSCVFKKSMGRMNFVQAIQILTPAIPAIWYVYSEQCERRWVGYMHPKGFLA